MKFYNEKEKQYLEIDVSGVSFKAGPLQVRETMQFPKDRAHDNSALQQIAFASKSLTRAETGCSNIKKRYTPWIRKIHYYCFAPEISIITDYKPLVEIFKKDVANLSHRLQ